jgi:REP element-mobilizing transposase RayT
MSNHIHIILRSSNNNLSNTIRDFKRHTSKAIISHIENNNESRKKWMLNVFKFEASKHKRNDEYQVWTHENHAEILYSNEFIAEKVNYIHNNPVRAGIAAKPEDYLYSSAVNYADGDGLLEIILVSLPMKTL